MRTERNETEAGAKQRGCAPLTFNKREQPTVAPAGSNVAASGTKTITNVRTENSDND